MIFWRFLDVYQCSDSLCLSDCFFVRGEVVGDIAVLLPPSWIWFGVVLYVVRHDFSYAYRCFDISFWNDCLRVLRYGESFGGICCDGLAYVLVCSVLFGFPGMVSYGLDHLYWLIVLGLVCLVVSVCAGLAGSVLSWFGSPDIPWSDLISFAPFCFAQVLSLRFGLHWSGQWCSAPGRLVLVKLSSVLFALVCSDVGPLCSTLDWSALVFLGFLLKLGLPCSICWAWSRQRRRRGRRPQDLLVIA